MNFTYLSTHGSVGFLNFFLNSESTNKYCTFEIIKGAIGTNKIERVGRFKTN